MFTLVRDRYRNHCRGPIVSYCVSPVPCTRPVPFPCSVNKPLGLPIVNKRLNSLIMFCIAHVHIIYNKDQRHFALNVFKCLTLFKYFETQLNPQICHQLPDRQRVHVCAGYYYKNNYRSEGIHYTNARTKVIIFC